VAKTLLELPHQDNGNSSENIPCGPKTFIHRSPQKMHSHDISNSDREHSILANVDELKQQLNLDLTN